MASHIYLKNPHRENDLSLTQCCRRFWRIAADRRFCRASLILCPFCLSVCLCVRLVRWLAVSLAVFLYRWALLWAGWMAGCRFGNMYGCVIIISPSLPLPFWVYDTDFPPRCLLFMIYFVSFLLYFSVSSPHLSSIFLILLYQGLASVISNNKYLS